MNKSQVRIFTTFNDKSKSLHIPYRWAEYLIDNLLRESTYIKTLYL